MKIYLASSWRNKRYEAVLAYLRNSNHEVYDFKNPTPVNKGFSWKETTGVPKELWTPKFYRDEVLKTARATKAFNFDMDALKAADACVLVLPCGRSAHLELGYAVGARKKTIVFMDDVVDEPELMYLMCGHIATNYEELDNALMISAQQIAKAMPYQCNLCHKPTSSPTLTCYNCIDEEDK